jgi:hypothetical protein
MSWVRPQAALSNAKTDKTIMSKNMKKVHMHMEAQQVYAFAP